MTGDEIIAKFNLQVDDASELSDTEELDLLNDVYGDICDDRDWEWLKKTYTGPYISLPADFKKLVPNKDGKSVIFVGTDYQEYLAIPFSSRRNFRNQDGFCYIDIPNQRLYFTLQPTSAKSIEYDYIKIQDDITANTSPIFRSGFHPIISFGMAASFPQIEQANKLTSYENQNQIDFNSILHDMAIEDANIKLSI